MDACEKSEWQVGNHLFVDRSGPLPRGGEWGPAGAPLSYTEHDPTPTRREDLG